MSKVKPVIMITRRGCTVFKTIELAVVDTGISKSKIRRALASFDGQVRGTFPPVFFDEAFLTQEDVEELESNQKFEK